MATKLLYLEAFDVLTCDAQVTAVRAAEGPETDTGNTVVELEQTCFYPRGGGQDWDTGTIMAADGAVFAVAAVRLNENGVAQHYGTFTQGRFGAGTAVQCAVDEARRVANTRLHSAGHLIDMAVARLGWSWEPGRGAHYPHMAFVEYATGDQVVDDAVRTALQSKIDELLAAGDYQNQLLFMPPAEMTKYCRHVPDNLPTNKPARIVLYADDFGIPCGGTHVRRVSDIGRVEITKLKSKKGITKVTYRVEGVN